MHVFARRAASTGNVSSVLSETAQNVTLLTLARPAKLNSLNQEMIDSFTSHYRTAVRSGAALVIIKGEHSCL